MVGPKSTTAELKTADNEISAELKGHMSNIERAWRVADRREIRAELERRRDAENSKAHECAE